MWRFGKNQAQVKSEKKPEIKEKIKEKIKENVEGTGTEDGELLRIKEIMLGLSAEELINQLKTRFDRNKEVDNDTMMYLYFYNVLFISSFDAYGNLIITKRDTEDTFKKEDRETGNAYIYGHEEDGNFVANENPINLYFTTGIGTNSARILVDMTIVPVDTTTGGTTYQAMFTRGIEGTIEFPLLTIPYKKLLNQEMERCKKLSENKLYDYCPETLLVLSSVGYEAFGPKVMIDRFDTGDNAILSSLLEFAAYVEDEDLYIYKVKRNLSNEYLPISYLAQFKIEEEYENVDIQKMCYIGIKVKDFVATIKEYVYYRTEDGEISGYIAAEDFKPIRVVSTLPYHSYIDVIQFISQFNLKINNEQNHLEDILEMFAHRSAWLGEGLTEENHRSNYMLPSNENYDGIITLIWSIYNEMYRIKDTHNEVWKKFAGDRTDGTTDSVYPLHWYYSIIGEEGNIEEGGGEDSNAWYIYNFFKTLNEQLGSDLPGPVPEGELRVPDEMFVYKPFGLKVRYVVSESGISLNTEVSSRNRKKKVTEDEMTVDEDLKRLMKKIGYEVEEVRDFVGYKKPTISRETEVSVNKDNELIEYSQVMSLIQEERNKIQSGKVTERDMKDLYVIGVMQDRRGTYMIVYGNEPSNESVEESVDVVSETNDGNVIVWSKSYNAETLDYRSDNYWKNNIYLQNDDNMSITYEKELWDRLIRDSEVDSGEMLGYFVVRMVKTEEESPEEDP